MNTRFFTEFTFVRKKYFFIIIYYSSQGLIRKTTKAAEHSMSICLLKITHETHIRTFLLRNKGSMLKRLKIPLCIFRRKLTSRR